MPDTTTAAAPASRSAQSPAGGGGVAKTVATAGGVGIGVLLATVFQGHPEMLTEMARSWGPGMILAAGVIFGLGFLMDRHLPPAIGAMRDQAAAMTGLSDSIQRRFLEEDDVRMATRTLSSQVEKLADSQKEITEKLDTLLEQCPGCEVKKT